MAIQKIQGEQPFQVLATNFSIGPSNEGYTLQISANGKDYSDLFSVGANVTRMVTGVANGSYYRLSGNNSEVSINWRTQCNDGGSGGGSGTGSTVTVNQILSAGTEIAQITVDGSPTSLYAPEGGQGGTSKSYVLNEMTQQERKDLYDELVVWRNDNTGGILSGFPAGDYSFFVNVDFGDEYRGIVPLSISFMHPSDYGGAIFFDGVVGDRRNYPISYIERYVIISDGSVDTNRLAVGGHQFSTFNYSWIGRMSYDADNSVFKRGDTTLAADTSYDSFETSNTIDYLIDKGGREDDYPAFSLYMPIFPIYVISGGTEQKYTSPKIIGKNISSTTVDGQTYTRQYFYIYDKEDGSRFIISCLLNNNNNAANFTYTAV